MNKLCIVVDAPGSVFETIALNLRKEFEFDIHYYQYTPEELYRDYDHVHFICWPSVQTMPKWQYDSLLERKVSHGIYAHVGFEKDLPRRKDIINYLCDSYTVSNTFLMKKAYQMYKDKLYLHPPRLFHDGVDLDFFKRQKSYNPSGNLRVGWVGDSAWSADKSPTNDYKGLNTIIRPAVKTVEGHLTVIDKNVNPKSREQVRDWLETLDVLAVASINEGTPNPLLEAAAMGIPIVTPNIGLVPLLMKSEISRTQIAERSVEGFVEVLNKFKNPKLLIELGKENKKNVQPFAWNRDPLNQFKKLISTTKYRPEKFVLGRYLGNTKHNLTNLLDELC